MNKIKQDGVSITSKEEYLDEIKKLLPKIRTMEAMKSIYEMAVICMANEKRENQSR